MPANRYDLLVVGSGPGGYVAAIRASQLKMKVAVVERDRLGGVCLNWGCIPSKALLNSAETMETIRGAEKEHGIAVGEVRVDFKRVIARSRETADRFSKGISFLFKKNKIDAYQAHAVLAGPNTVALEKAPDGPDPSATRIDADRILLATGSGEKLFQGLQVGDGLMTSKEALLCDRLPKDVVIIGAGAIGCEFAYFYQAFGAKVTVVELLPQMLPGIDKEVAEELRRAFNQRGVTALLGHGFKSLKRNGDRWSVLVEAGGAEKTLDADAVLVAVGRGPLSAGIGLDKAGVELEPGGFVKTDDAFRTTCPSIYAIGDVLRPPLLAHKASAEAIAAVEIMAGAREPGFDLTSVPACIYCEPEVATVGLSEAQAQERGIEVKVGKIPFRVNGKAVGAGHPEGFVKLVASKQYGEVIGCQIIGHHATDLISEVVLGKNLEATTAEFGRAVHPHPTLSEVIMEAALAAEGGAINV